MVGTTFGLAVKKDSKGLNDGFREVFLVEKDGQDRRYRISPSIEFQTSGNGAKWLASDEFDLTYRILNAKEMELFTDDSHITQLLYPSPYNMIYIHCEGGKLLESYASCHSGALLRMLYRSDGEDHRALFYCVSFTDKQQIGRGDCPLIVAEVRSGNGTQQRKLYKNSETPLIALGEAKCMDLCFDRVSFESARQEISFERARQEIKYFDSLEMTSSANIQLDDFEDKIEALFYRRKGAWYPASEDTDKIPTMDHVIPDLKSALLCFGTISTLLATIAATAYFVVGLAFAQVESLESTGIFYEYAKKPTFVAFLLFIGLALFSSLSSISIVAFAIFNMVGPTIIAGKVLGIEVEQSYIQHIPASFNGEDTSILQVELDWQKRRGDGLWVTTCWAGYSMMLAVFSIFMAAILGGFLVLYSVNPYACIGFIIIAAVCMAGLFFVFTAGWQAFNGRHHLSFWQTLSELIYTTYRTFMERI